MCIKKIKMVKTKEEILTEYRRLLKNKKYIKNTLDNFKSECGGKMIVVNSELILTNQDFNEIFEKLIKKLSPDKSINKLKGVNQRFPPEDEWLK